MIDRNIPFSGACYTCPTEYSQLFTGRLVAFWSCGLNYSKKYDYEKKIVFEAKVGRKVPKMKISVYFVILLRIHPISQNGILEMDMTKYTEIFIFGTFRPTFASKTNFFRNRTF
jgi:hypothetical protein